MTTDRSLVKTAANEEEIREALTYPLCAGSGFKPGPDGCCRTCGRHANGQARMNGHRLQVRPVHAWGECETCDLLHNGHLVGAPCLSVRGSATALRVGPTAKGALVKPAANHNDCGACSGEGLRHVADPPHGFLSIDCDACDGTGKERLPDGFCLGCEFPIDDCTCRFGLVVSPKGVRPVR